MSVKLLQEVLTDCFVVLTRDSYYSTDVLQNQSTNQQPYEAKKTPPHTLDTCLRVCLDEVMF